MTIKFLNFEEWLTLNPDIKDVEEECPDCFGDGIEDCPYCSQPIECDTCDGSGKKKTTDAKAMYYTQLIKEIKLAQKAGIEIEIVDLLPKDFFSLSETTLEQVWKAIDAEIRSDETDPRKLAAQANQIMELS